MVEPLICQVKMIKKKKIKNHDFLSYDVVTFALRIATFRMHNEPINKNHFREYLVFYFRK